MISRNSPERAPEPTPESTVEPTTEPTTDSTTTADGLPGTASRPRTIAELPSTWRPWRLLRERMDDGIAGAYVALGIEGVSTRYTAVLMFLEDGPLSIRELAESCDVTHSAMSQSVAAMRKAGLVESAPGEDARSRVVSLTARGREIAPQLWSEWYATEETVREVADEAGVSLDDIVATLNAALDRESFTDRLLRRMAESPK